MKIYEPKDLFSVEEHYKQFVSVLYQKTPQQLHPTQQIHVKQAFFSGWGQCLLNMRDNVAAIPDEDEATTRLDEMIKEVINFLKAQSKPQSN